MSDLLLKCTVCRGLLDEEDLFCPNCGTEAPTRQESTQTASRVSTQNFQCSGCGASMSYDASAGSLRCPFCGSDNLVEQTDSKTVAPTSVVPFVISHDDAVSRMKDWLGKGFWRPGDLAQQAAVVSMTAVYVPYWVFRADTHTYWTSDTSQTPSGARGDWYPLTGEYKGYYTGVLVGASGALTSAETSAICPYQLNQGVAPEQVDLDNVIVEQFSVQRKYARPLARQGLEELEKQACQQFVPANSRNMKVNTRITDLHSEPMLLPVYIMAYRYRDEVFRFLVNGQTGQATGHAPRSLFKIFGAIALAIVLLLVVLAIVASVSGCSVTTAARERLAPPKVASPLVAGMTSGLQLPTGIFHAGQPITFMPGATWHASRSCTARNRPRTTIAICARSGCVTWSGSARSMLASKSL